MNPGVLLLDEPLSSLDASLRRHLKDEIRRIHDERDGMTTLYVTHDREEAFSISDRIMVMRNGKIETSGKSEDVYTHPETLFSALFTGEGTALPSDLFSLGSVADTIFFRPEDVIVKDGPFYGDEQSYMALEGLKITGAEYIGSRYNLALEFKNHSIIAETAYRPKTRIVNIYISKSKILFYKDGRLVL